MSCIATNSCFPLDPCLDAASCHNGRWPCESQLLVGNDDNSSLGQCQSDLGSGVVFYFAANVALFGLICLGIFLCHMTSILSCARCCGCGKKKADRTKLRGEANKLPKDGTTGGGAAAKTRPSRAQSLVTSSPSAPLPNLRSLYEVSKLASAVISHDVEDGDGVILETINSRALTNERATAARLFRTCGVLVALVSLDDAELEKVESTIGSSLAEAFKLVTDGFKLSTSPEKGKASLTRAALLFQDIIQVIVNECLPQCSGAEKWAPDGPEHKYLDAYISKFQDILDIGPPERSCSDLICWRADKLAPELPEPPDLSTLKISSSALSVPIGDHNSVNLATTEAASGDKPGLMLHNKSDEKRRGLTGMASEICMRSARNFDTSLLSSRHLVVASSMNLDAEKGVSNANLVGGGESVPAKESLITRLEMSVSRMQTERALTKALPSSLTPAALPDLNKIFEHAELCADLHDAVRNANVNASREDRSEAIRVYRIVGLFCKLLDLDPSALDQHAIDKIGPLLNEAQVLMTEGMKSSTLSARASEVFAKATTLLVGVIEGLTAPDGPFNGFPGASSWPVNSVEFLALDEYVHDCMLLFEDEPRRTCLQRMWYRSPVIWRKLWQAFGIPDSMRNYPAFYFFYLLTWALLIVRFFIITCDVGSEILSGDGLSNITLSALGTVPPYICLQVPGRTYLGVGPQYKAILGKGHSADLAVPLMFGLMHSLLFIFGSLPIPMARGFWRDVSYWMPWLRRVLPIDDHIFVHKFFGYLALFNLFWGALIWTVVMGPNECFFGTSHAACTAWDPTVVQNWFNLFENVVMLRVVVVILWFFGLTWMRYQNDVPKYWFFGLCCFTRLPTTFRQHFFEYAYILHVIIALATFVLAQAARFQVFYPTMAPWCLYIADSLRETLFMTFRSDIEVAKSTVHLDPSDHDRPTTMTVKLENPLRSKWRGGCIRKRPSQGAGMWVFVKIPAVSEIEWHPFTLASADGDDFVQLQIGIRAGVSMGWRKPDNWVLDDSSALSKVTAEGVWVQKRAKTWTYKLYELLVTAEGDAKIPCMIRGPYGSSFRLCFKRSIKGALIMGAGTGLSAVESMLRAMLHRREKGRYTPNHVWVCWQARRVGDLLWMWDALNQLLIKALNDGTIKKPLSWTPASKTLGFLRVTFFISRADSSQLDTLRHLPKHPDDNQSVHEWLTSRNRILQSSISNEGTHISKYIRHVRAELSRLEENRHAKLGISFCGPSAVSKLIADAAVEVGGGVEFSSDATA